MLSTANYATEAEFDPSAEMIAAINGTDSDGPPASKRRASGVGSSASAIGGIYSGGFDAAGQSQNATQGTTSHIIIE